MTELFVIQLVEMVLALTGFVAITASAGLFRSPVSAADERRMEPETEYVSPADPSRVDRIADLSSE